jgi:hypothetical protein
MNNLNSEHIPNKDDAELAAVWSSPLYLMSNKMFRVSLSTHS